MCTVCIEREMAKPKFALFNYVFSSNAADLITVESVRENLLNAGVEISTATIEDSFGKWRRMGMLHKEGDGFRLGSY